MDEIGIINIVKTVAKKARKANLKVVMGGGVSMSTLELLERDLELQELLDFVETRKTVMPIGRFLDKEALVQALELEKILLGRRSIESSRILLEVDIRLNCLTARV